jgi:hypothetical protein
LWQFNPTVVNGTVSAESFVIAEHEVGQIVVGRIGWSGLRSSDPAHDLHWLSGAGEAADSVFAAYTAASSRTPDARIRVRAMLYAELELARWLLHGKDTHDQAVVDDAVSMLDGLVEHVLGDVMHPLSQHTGPVLSVDDVETLLSRTPRTSGPGGGTGLETDSYDRSELENAMADRDGDVEDTTTHDAETGPIEVIDSTASHDDSHGGRAPVSEEERERRRRASARETVELDTTGWIRSGDDQLDGTDPTARSQRDRSSDSE